MTWETVKASARNKDDIDIDTDLVYHSEEFSKGSDALAYAKKVYDEGDSAFGEVKVQKQIVDWLSRYDRIGEWIDCDEPIYMSMQES